MSETPELAAIRQAGVVLSPADQYAAVVQLAERQAKALNAVRALHPRKIRPFPGDVFEAICVGCGNLWPCATIRAIDEAGAPAPDPKSLALGEIQALVDQWMEFAGPGTETERVLGRQVVSVGFVHRNIRAVLARHGLTEAATC